MQRGRGGGGGDKRSCSRCRGAPWPWLAVPTHARTARPRVPHAAQGGKALPVDSSHTTSRTCVVLLPPSLLVQVLGLNRSIYALKRVRFHNKDPEAVLGFIDEIALLRQLRARPNIIQLIDAQVGNY